MARNAWRGTRENPLPGWQSPIPPSDPTATPAQKRAYGKLTHTDPNRGAFWEDIGEKGSGQHAVAVESLLNSRLASPDDLDDLGEQSEILWLALGHIDHVYGGSVTDLTAMRGAFLADLRALAALARGAAPTADSADRLNAMRELAVYRTSYLPGGVGASRPQGLHGIKHARQKCGDILRFIEGVSAKGLSPLLCAFGRCDLGIDGDRRWFVPVRKGSRWCSNKCNTDFHNADHKGRRDHT